jgi:hypothetical protein
MTWFLRHRILLSLVVLMGSFFVAFWAADWLDGRVRWSRGATGFVAAGLMVASVDLVGRALIMPAAGLWGFVQPSTGLAVKGIPLWMFGLVFLFGAYAMTAP